MESAAQPWVTPKALTFDVFGTLVDWHSSIVEEGRRLGARVGVATDWHQFALDWRAGYEPAMQRVNRREVAWQSIDDLHRQILDELVVPHGLERLSEPDLRELNRAWHRLRAWPDVKAGLARLRRKFVTASLSNGNVSLLVDLARFNGWEWDCVLSSELARRYKPDPAVYATAASLLGLPPAEIMMVAAHPHDLAGARAVGFSTAYVARPQEYGSGAAPANAMAPARRHAFDLYASDMGALASLLNA